MFGGSSSTQHNPNQSKEINFSSPNFGGIPGHLDDNERIIITGQKTGRRPAQEDRVLHRDSSGMFAERMASVIGPSYTSAFFIGAALGLTKIPPPKSRRTYRLLMNNYLNNIGKTSSRFGNNVGGAIFMYLIVGKSLNFVFKEELENFSDVTKSAMFGAVTGAIYKSTRGVRPIIFASFLGAIAGSLYTTAWERGMLKIKV